MEVGGGQQGPAECMEVRPGASGNSPVRGRRLDPSGSGCMGILD